MLLLALILAAAVSPVTPGPAQPPQTFRLEAGDFSWLDFPVHQTPTLVNCRFEVVSGGPTVHAELLPLSEFRRFDRGREHDTMALTPKARSGQFRRMIDTRGQYAIVVVNEQGAAPAVVALTIETTINPKGADVAQTLSPRRRLTVIALSFAFFIVTVSWSSRKLIGAMKFSSMKDHSIKHSDS